MALEGWPGDGSVLYADGLEVEGVVGPMDLRLVPGNVIGLIGPVGARTGAALALSGRLETTGGRARVAGALLPQAAGNARRRVTYLDLAHVDDPAAALSAVRPGTVVFIDSVDLVTGPEAEAALTALLARVRADGAVVLCAAVEDHLSHFSLDGTYAAPAIAHEGSRA